MELYDVDNMRVKMEDALIDIKLWDPQRKELKEKVKGLKGLIKPLLKVIRMIESRIDGFGPNEKKVPMSIDRAKNFADDIKDKVEFCLKKYEEVRKLVEEEEQMLGLKNR
jgi:archaellum component FlaC